MLVFFCGDLFALLFIGYWFLQAIQGGVLELDFRGAAIGNGFVSPADTFLAYADILFSMVATLATSSHTLATSSYTFYLQCSSYTFTVWIEYLGRPSNQISFLANHSNSSCRVATSSCPTAISSSSLSLDNQFQSLSNRSGNGLNSFFFPLGNYTAVDEEPW